MLFFTNTYAIGDSGRMETFMFIGSLMNRTSKLSGNYSFTRRGTKKLLQPDVCIASNQQVCKDNLINEGFCQAEGSYPLYEGILFSGNPFGWSGLKVFDIGIDLSIKFGRTCYVDTVLIKLSENSGLEDVTVLSQNQAGELDIIGLREKHTDPMLDTRGVSRCAVRNADYTVKNQIVVPVGFSTDNVIIRFKSNLLDIVIEKFDITGAVFDEAKDTSPVYPIPSKFEKSDGDALSPEKISTIIIPDNADEDCKFAANLLKERLFEDYSVSIPISYKGGKASSDGAVIIGKCSDIQNIESDFYGMPQAEGYALKTGSDYACINAIDRLGLVIGVGALLQLFENKVRQCKVESSPYLPFRGVHMGLPPREEIQFFKRLIRYVVAPMGYNRLFLEFAGGMRYNSHPEINEAWEKANIEDRLSDTPWVRTSHGTMVAGGSYLEQDEVADMVAYVRSYGIDVIPEVQSLSHVQYITCAHPEIGETAESNNSDNSVDERTEDVKPSTTFANSYCPSNEKSYEIIFDLIDEIVNVVKPKEYVHMGHDEVYTMGVCPRCEGKDHAVLFATHINRVHKYLADKNLKMMIWSDMLQPTTAYKTPPAIDMIPKDIIMLDFIWYFNFALDYEDTLLNKGFEVMMGNLYSSHYPRYEQRIRKSNMNGGLFSTWCRIDEETFAREGKFFDIMYTANMLWSESYSENLRLTYGKIISSMLPALRSKLHAEKYPSLIEGKTAMPISLPASDLKLPKSIGNIVEKIPQQGINNYWGVPFDLSALKIISYDSERASELNISINDKFNSLVFLQTTLENAERFAWLKFLEIGEYVVTYEDGTNCRVPITYGGNIRAWYQRFGEPLPHQYYRHEGYISTYFADPFIETKAYDGRDVTVYGYEWINPYKDKKIASVKCSSIYESDADILLFGITGIK